MRRIQHIGFQSMREPEEKKEERQETNNKQIVPRNNEQDLNDMLLDTYMNGLEKVKNNAAFYNRGKMIEIIQFKYQEMNAAKIINNPIHQCSKSCVLSLLFVSVAHLTDEKFQHIEGLKLLTGNEFNRENFVDYDIRFHNFPQFRQEKTRFGTKRLFFENLFVCGTTGKIHSCGEGCILTTKIDDRGSFICPLTGMVTGMKMCFEDDWKEKPIIFGAAENVNNPLNTKPMRVYTKEDVCKKVLHYLNIFITRRP